jgi:hypothetical protein
MGSPQLIMFHKAYYHSADSTTKILGLGVSQNFYGNASRMLFTLIVDYGIYLCSSTPFVKMLFNSISNQNQKCHDKIKVTPGHMAQV